MQIIVLGMHRAGTSAVTRLINMMGAYLGPNNLLMPASSDNPKGYWERVDIQQLNEFVLKKSDANWRNVSKIDPTNIDPTVLDEFRQRASKIIVEMNGHSPWIIKDPRLCLLFQLWLPLLQFPLCIHVARHPMAVAQSLKKRDGLPLHFGIALWEHYNTRAILASNGLPRLTVSYERLMEKPNEAVEELYKALSAHGAPSLQLPNKHKTAEFLNNELQHYKIAKDNSSDFLTLGQTRLWNILNAEKMEWHYAFNNLDVGMAALKDYEQLFTDLGKLRTEIHHLNVKATEHEKKINQLELNAELNNTNNDSLIKKYVSDVNTMIRLFESLHHDTQLAFDSMTWKLGYLIAEAGRKIGVLQRSPMVQDHIKRIIKSYQIWRNKNPFISKDAHRSIIILADIKNTFNYNNSLESLNFKEEHEEEYLNFNEEDYLNRYPDVKDAVERGQFRNGLEHYQLLGRNEILGGTRPYSTSNSSLPLKIYNEDDRIQCKLEIEKWQRKPVISVIMPVYNVELKWLKAAINSVRHQIYPHWQLCIVDDHSSRQETLDYLKSLDHPAIQLKILTENQGIALASNAALSLATGEYLTFLDHDDEITPDAFYEIVKIINKSDPDLIYSDEDKLTLEGYYIETHFKPDYSPDLIFSINYICHLSVYRKSLLEKIGHFRTGFEGAQDYDLLLRALDHTDRVFHIPRILYHWRKISGSTAAKFNNKHYAWEAGRLAIADTLKRRNIEGTVALGHIPGNYRVQRKLLKSPKISIIIPFKDKPDLLKQCLDSILLKTTYPNFEIIGVSNNSSEAETFSLMDAYKNQDARIRFLSHDIPFNFPAINNFAVKQATGEHLILLNNDIVVITPDWLEALLEHSQRPDVGAVGAKLYYPDDTVQHGGVIIGLGGIAGHAHKYYQRGDTGYFHRLNLIQNFSAVTAACLMVKKSLYELIGGMDEANLPIAFNDVDFCLRLREKGYLNVFTPYCELYHHESKTRGYEDTPQKKQRFAKEIAYMRKRHATILRDGDPYYNINLPLDREDFGML
ncbi:MAG: glycosyltransferase [Candidatus Competibacter sp.]